MKKILAYLAAALLVGVLVFLPRPEEGGAYSKEPNKSSSSIRLTDRSHQSDDLLAANKRFAKTDRLRADTRLFLESSRSQASKQESSEAAKDFDAIRVLGPPAPEEVRDYRDADSPGKAFNQSMLAQEQKSLVFVWKSQEQTSRTSEYSDNSLPSKHEEGVTSHLASQSFENFYTALFGLNSDRQNHLFDLAALAGRQRSANLTGHLQENPFAETINQLKNNPASASQASSDFPNTTQAQNSANGSPPRGKDQPGGSKSSPQPETPDSSSDLPKKPVSQFTIPGGIKPFAIVGDIKHDGRGIVIPGFRMQGNQFEIPFVGMVSLKLLVIPDPAMTTRSVAIDDLNGDGIADIALASAADPFVMIWCGLPTGEFYYLGGFGAPNGGRSITSGDFNGDGKMDLALLQPADDQNVDILLGDGTGRFNYATTVRFASSIDMLYASDITSGHNRDLLGTNLVYYRSFLLASSGNATLLKRTEFSFANIPTVLLFSDLNLDGRLEELFLFQDRQQLSVVLNPTRPLIMQHIANYNLKYPVFLVIGDLFGMGAIDLGIAPIPK